MEFFTIGVFNSSEREYFKKLSDNLIDTFCDFCDIQIFDIDIVTS
jgi:hypothetical protein